MPGKRGSISILLVVIAVMIISIAFLPGWSDAEYGELTFTEVIDRSLSGEICRLVESSDAAMLTYYTECTANSEAAGRIPKSTLYSVAEYLQQEMILRQQQALLSGQAPPTARIPEIQSEPPSAWRGLLGSITIMLPTILLIGLFWLMLPRSQSSNDQTFSFGKSRARRVTSNNPIVTFADVAGQEEAKQDLREVVDFLTTPAKFQRVGARIPHGILMIGPPGTGKTLLARAVAGEARVPFFSISASEFVEIFVGVGASRVRDLFLQGRRNAPCIIFIDEIDAVGRRRGAGQIGQHDEREQTLNQILVEMDGFDTSTRVVVLAATNRADILDPALVRPGRFDRHVLLDTPDLRGRLEILAVHTRGLPFEASVDLRAIARETPGASGADLANIVNEAAILAARRDKQRITMLELEDATQRLLFGGPERRSRVLTPQERRITAYHEAGHAVVARAMPKADPVYKISIVPRAQAGGYTQLLPREDQHFRSKQQFEALLAYAMGGRAAEELIVGDITNGASNDIQQATRIAREMTTSYGMSDTLGPVMLHTPERAEMFPASADMVPQYSEETARLIDAEIKRLLETAHQQARSVLDHNRPILHELASTLLEMETLGGAELRSIIDRVQPIGCNPTIPAVWAGTNGSTNPGGGCCWEASEGQIPAKPS